MQAGNYETANTSLLEHLQGSGTIVTGNQEHLPVAYNLWITAEAEVSGFVYSEGDSRFVASHFDGHHVLELTDGRRLRFSFLNERGGISPHEWLTAGQGQEHGSSKPATR